MKIKMTLMSDAIPGNGESIPGAEDISVLHDNKGFPYYKGGTLKGIFREEMTNYLDWTGESFNELDTLLGKSGDDQDNKRKLRFSDLTLSENVRNAILNERIEGRQLSADEILEIFSYMRTFTALDEDGIVKDGSLRYARCLTKGLIFYGNITCADEDKELVKEVLSLICSIGTMRNRGFGNVKIEAV